MRHWQLTTRRNIPEDKRGGETSRDKQLLDFKKEDAKFVDKQLEAAIMAAKIERVVQKRRAGAGAAVAAETKR